MAAAKEVRKGYGLFCKRSCYHASTILPPESVFDKPFIRTDDGCRLLIQTRGKNAGELHNSYINVIAGGVLRAAHQLVWELTNHQSIPDGLLVRHLCPGGGNRNCIEPTHLTIGTYSDNGLDASAAGRLATGDRNHKTKLTADQVRYIREHYVPRDPAFSGTALGKRFNVNEGTILAIIHGKIWRHLK